jgi:hypothetical protein
MAMAQRLKEEGDDQLVRSPTVIYMPSEIEWFSEGAVWILNIEEQKVGKQGGIHYTEQELKSAVSDLVIEMLAQLESLAAYVDDLETDQGGQSSE